MGWQLSLQVKKKRSQEQILFLKTQKCMIITYNATDFLKKIFLSQPSQIRDVVLLQQSIWIYLLVFLTVSSLNFNIFNSVCWLGAE